MHDAISGRWKAHHWEQPAYRAPWLPGFGKEADYALCSADTAQVVHASGTYDLPFGRKQAFLNNVNPVVDAFMGGWITNFIFSHQTGQPFTLGARLPTTADFGCFADIVPGQNIYAGAAQRSPVAQSKRICESAGCNPDWPSRLLATRR